MADLTSMLLAAAQADRNAESALNEWLQSNPCELSQALAHEVANDTKSFAARQMAAIYLKNMLMAQSVAVQKEKFDRWKMLDPQARNVVKECLLRALRHPTGANAAATNGQTLPEHSLPHFCAVAIAEIAVVELPHNEWPTLVPSVMENVSTTSTPEYVKIASLECLGYTCERYADVEDMFGDAWPVLHETTVNDMLTTIVDGVQPTRPESIRHAAITALKNSLLFVRSNMEKPLERKFIINAITQACKSPDPRVRATAYACLDTVAEQYYECLPDHMTEIYNLSTECINRGEAEEESVKMAAIEFWTQLATVEQRLLDEEREATEVGMALPRLPCPKYVEAAMTNLVPLLLNTLTHQDEDSEGGEFNWDLQASGAVCLETISQTVEGAILAHVIPFVTQHIQSADWRYRDAAIVAFSSILDGPSTEQVADYVTQSIQVLLQSFQDQKAIVRWSAVRCIGKICQLHMTAVSPSATHAILDQLLQQLKDARTKIAAASCSAIFDMAEAFKPMGEAIPDSNLLSAPMLPLMQNLMTASDREDSGEDNLRVAAMSAAAVLITASALDVEPIFAELLPNIIGRTEVALKRQVFSNDDREAKEQVLGLLCGLLHGLYMRMPKEAVMQHTDKVVQLLLQVFQLQDASCHEEGFMVIGAIANKVEEDFVNYMQAFSPILLQGLSAHSATSLCQTAVGVLVDICGAIGPALQPFADGIMSALFACIRNENVHRDVKPIVISCFGDVAMAIAAAYDPYLPISAMLLMQASSQQPPADNEDMVYFINRLRTSVLEAYSGIIVGFADGQALERLESLLPQVLQFLSSLSLDATKDEVVLQKAVALIGDFANEMGTFQAVKEQLNQPFISQLIREGLASPDDQVRETAAWTGQVVQGALGRN